MSEHISAIEAQRLLDAATPGPWVRPSGTSSWFTVPEPVQVDEADWGPEAQERGLFGYRVGTLADERAWRYGDVELMAAAPRLAAEVVRLRRELHQWEMSAATLARVVRLLDNNPNAATFDRDDVAGAVGDQLAAARLLGGGE